MFHSYELFPFFHSFSAHFFFEDTQIFLNVIFLCKTFQNKKYFEIKENGNICVDHNFGSKGYSFIYKFILTVQLISLAFPVVANQIITQS